MSQPHSTAPATDGHDDAHEGPIKTPKQLIWTVVASFVVPIVAIILLVNYVAFGPKPGAGSDLMDPQAVAERLQPVSRIELRDASAPRAIRAAEVVYSQACTACHAIGAAGAPKSGDTAAWAPRIKTGYEALLNSALKGKGAMPAQGGGEYSDYEIATAVVFMVNKAGGNFPEPKKPEPPAEAPKQ
jgi:cytochrome c5